MLKETMKAMSDGLPLERIEPLRQLLPTASQRQFMQRLHTDKWKRLVSVSVAAGPGLLSRMMTNGWIERRCEGQDCEIRLADAGLNALKAKIP